MKFKVKTILDLNKNKTLFHLNGLEELTQLLVLSASSCALEDITGLKNTKITQVINLFNNNLSNLNGLEGAVNLTKTNSLFGSVIDISKNIDLSDISGLKNLKKVKHIHMDSTMITTNQVRELCNHAHIKKINADISIYLELARDWENFIQNSKNKNIDVA